MLARRIIAVTPDKAFGKQLAVALKAAGGAVDTQLSLEALGTGELPAHLLVLHLDGPMAGAAHMLIPRLPRDSDGNLLGAVIVILPRTDLPAMVDLMQAFPNIAGTMIAEDFDMKLMSAMATRVLAGDIFGLEKHVPWGAQIHSFLVGDYQEKSLCIAQIAEFAESMSVRRKYRESIEQCLDEMLMNALYDAPVDELGRPIFSDIPTKTRISLRVEQKVVIQYACDGKQFVVGVRDAFGRLERDVVLRYLYKCLHSEQQIDRKAGGAGLGLYLITNSATGVYFNVLPGVATEAVCTFDLASPKIQLEGFGFFVEKIDAAGRLASGPSKRLPVGASHPVERRQEPVRNAGGGSRALTVVLALATLAALALVAFAAWPRIFGPAKTAIQIHTVPPGAVIELEGRNVGTAGSGALIVKDLEVGRPVPIVARLEGYESQKAIVQPQEGDNNPVTLELRALAATVTIDSTPSGAELDVDGKPAGTTPVTLRQLAPGSTASLVFKKAGYHDATTRLSVPGPGKETTLSQPLSVTEELARVRLISEPPGAQVYQNGQLMPGSITPCSVLVEAGKPTRFMLAMPHKIPALLAALTPPHGADDIELHGKLVDGTTLRIKANVDARVKVGGAPHCQDVATPVECVVAPGQHLVELVVPQAPRITRTVTVKQKDFDVTFSLGHVEGNNGKLVTITPGVAARRATFEVGTRRVQVTGNDDGPHFVTVTVRAGQTTVVN